MSCKKATIIFTRPLYVKEFLSLLSNPRTKKKFLVLFIGKNLIMPLKNKRGAKKLNGCEKRIGVKKVKRVIS